MLKFAANISTMFTEYDFKDRFTQAKNNGFEFVEMQSPYDYDAEILALSNPGLKCVLMNTFGDVSGFGVSSEPLYQGTFITHVHKTVRYRDCLDIKKVHILAGLRNTDFTMEDQFSIYVANLSAAAEILSEHNMIGVIEPICSEVKEDYLLSSFDAAVEAIKAVGCDNLKLLLDIYHLHKITGDVKKNLEIYYPYAGHIQISQDPGRHEPFFPEGKIDYKFVLDFLKEKKYSDPIGLEYIPSSSTVESLEWLKEYN